MNLVDRVISELKRRKENIANGNINSIPSPFIRFRNDFVGIEQAQYITITAGTKCGKSQLGNFLYLFHAIDYVYKHRDIVSIKILYFALEETPERVLQRYMSYLLYVLSGNKYRISPKDLRSTDNDKPLSDDIIDLLESEEYRAKLDFFEQCVIFYNEGNNPTGIYKACRDYALSCGKVITKSVQYGNEVHDVFDHYVPDDPRHYKVVFIDHIGLIDLERGFTLKQSIDKLSEYMAKYLRNRYGFTCVAVQQQSMESESVESQKMGKIEASIGNLGDSKYTSRDSDVVLGLFSPYKFELPQYKGYDITRMKDNIRFLTILVNRNGEQGGTAPLFFDGAVCYYHELPLPKDINGIARVYTMLDKIRGASAGKLFHIIFNKLKTKKSRKHGENTCFS